MVARARRSAPPRASRQSDPFLPQPATMVRGGPGPERAPPSPARRRHRGRQTCTPPSKARRRPALQRIGCHPCSTHNAGAGRRDCADEQTSSSPAKSHTRAPVRVHIPRQASTSMASTLRRSCGSSSHTKSRLSVRCCAVSVAERPARACSNRSAPGRGESLQPRQTCCPGTPLAALAPRPYAVAAASQESPGAADTRAAPLRRQHKSSTKRALRWRVPVQCAHQHPTPPPPLLSEPRESAKRACVLHRTCATRP